MDDFADPDKIQVTIQVSFRPEGEIFRMMQISPRATRRNDKHLDSYKFRKQLSVGETAVVFAQIGRHALPHRKIMLHPEGAKL